MAAREVKTAPDAAKRAAGRAKGTRRGKRAPARSWIPLVLLGFVLVATGVIARRIYGLQQSRRLVALEQRRAALDAERLHLEGDIRDATSRGRLVPLAEQRLHMHVPAPNQVIILPRATPRPRPTAGHQ